MKVLLYEYESGMSWWIGEKGIKLCTDITDDSQARDMTEEEADIQIEHYGKYGFALDFKTEE